MPGDTSGTTRLTALATEMFCHDPGLAFHCPLSISESFSQHVPLAAGPP